MGRHSKSNWYEKVEDEAMSMDDDMEMTEQADYEMTAERMPRMRLAHAYVPWQCYENAYNPQEALRKGTLFPELFGVYKLPM